MDALTHAEIREANVRYHDLAADHYDGKWGITYSEVGQRQVLGKLRKALGARPGSYERGLEIGAGTGYFGLNLMRAGTIGALAAVDVSPRMLAALDASADDMRLEVETACCEAHELPFEDDSFDLVFGHAVLHHLLDLDAAFREFRRVLRPGGALAFCGEPSLYGDRVASYPKRAAIRVAPIWRRLMGAGPAPPGNGHHDEEAHLENVVDVHAFTPGDLNRHARAAGFERVRVSGEELAASMFGWANRSLEGTADQRQIPDLWRSYAYHGYVALQTLDRTVLEPRLPPALFYNLLVSAHVPA
jgi:ubiquinone/menaquinone biosynthesis C-methylase UbiE